MLYHTARISLNRTLIDRQRGCSHHVKTLSDAFELCDIAIESIVGIMRRYAVQNTLKNAPLSFVHGAVAALDATLLMISHSSLAEARPQPNVKDTVLPSIDAALADMSHAWDIARAARENLQTVLNNWHTNTTPGTEWFPSSLYSSPPEYQGSDPRRPPKHDRSPTTSPHLNLDMELLAQDSVDVDVANLLNFPYVADDSSDGSIWSFLATTSEQGTTPLSRTDSQAEIPYAYAT